ncbi:phage head closure protein [Enterococcus faecalis]|uniref:phage head closure protein n=1 Tax=Enterococcus faecalis TaxID=1351 RepID=UPI00094345DB|nr:phage head closure protein [Enterococcus faecalis]
MGKMTNQLQWKAKLLKVTQRKDKNNRPQIETTLVRELFYADIGITTQEKVLSLQSKDEVVRRIKIRWDRKITEKDHRIRIDETNYRIVRIWTNAVDREMELSLAYVS